MQQREEGQKDLQAALADLANQKFALDHYVIVSITNVTGRIFYANDKFSEISGYRREDILGLNHRLIKSGVRLKTFFTNLWRVIWAREMRHGEICNKFRTGQQFWVQADITVRKLMEVAINAAKARLRHITNECPVWCTYAR